MDDREILLHVLSHRDVEQIRVRLRLHRYRALLASANVPDAEADAICADLALELNMNGRSPWKMN